MNACRQRSARPRAAPPAGRAALRAGAAAGECGRRAWLPVERIVKLDANENPYGPSPRLRGAGEAAARYHIYPDPEQRRLREALGTYVGYEPEWLIAGAGSDELIELCCPPLRRPGEAHPQLPADLRHVSASSPASLGRARRSTCTRRDDFALDLRSVARSGATGASLIFAASPNNPTGTLLTRDELDALLGTGKPVVVDEAYAEFSGESYVGLVREHANLIVLRTLSKWAGLAGLRVGYMVADPAVDRHRRCASSSPTTSTSPPKSPPSPASTTCRCCRSASTHDRGERDRLAAMLRRVAGLRQCTPSSANFVLCRLEGVEAKKLQLRLWSSGIIVRYFDTPLLQNHLRISAGRPEQTDALLAALREISPSGDASQ